jgi:hypothetical protein
MPGECWAFEGEGNVVIQLPRKIKITGVSIEHASHALLPTEEVKSAPNNFSIWVSVWYSYSSYI